MLGDRLTDWLAADVAPDADQVFEAIEDWAADHDIELYPAQIEALIAVLAGEHVIVATPTGSGKSLVATGAHLAALARGQRSVYTAPIKALVSEKFFALVEQFGPQRVGMMTGDTAVNPTAPIICCTAEILANIALRDGAEAAVDQVVMDEFHFYADPQRGWAWQVPLLQLPRAQFVLMSATLGDVGFFRDDLERRTKRPVSLVASATRPVPLTFSYELTPLPELLDELIHTARAPIYVVHFTQAAATETAQSLLATPVAGTQQRADIAAAIGDFRFGPGFGAVVSKLLRRGIGVHHAGMLPRYRRLVERLAQAGLLRVICGTDTLGVGINVPIRTVLFTSLVKFDGAVMRHLTAREFHQIAGRAGRAGFDAIGDVIVQAPQHVIDNARAVAKAGEDERKRRKIVRKQAPPGRVNWTDKTFERLRDASPEPLTSQFRVTTAMVLEILARPGDPVQILWQLLTDNHEPPRERNPHLRSAARICRSLRDGGIVSRQGSDGGPARLHLTLDLPDDFALNQPLGTFALAAFDMLDAASPDYALDVVSVLEATMENPRQILAAQEQAAKQAALAAMKAEGIDYNERMAMLDQITYPQPLAEPLAAVFAIYRRTHPWVDDYELAPKSIVREMRLGAMTFPEFVSRYGLARSEGLVLRYLTDAYRALAQSVPLAARTEELNDIGDWLGQLIRDVDSSLLEEWERLTQLALPDQPSP